MGSTRKQRTRFAWNTVQASLSRRSHVWLEAGRGVRVGGASGRPWSNPACVGAVKKKTA